MIFVLRLQSQVNDPIPKMLCFLCNAHSIATIPAKVSSAGQKYTFAAVTGRQRYG